MSLIYFFLFCVKDVNMFVVNRACFKRGSSLNLLASRLKSGPLVLKNVFSQLNNKTRLHSDILQHEYPSKEFTC